MATWWLLSKELVEFLEKIILVQLKEMFGFITLKQESYFQVTFSQKNDHSPLWDAAGNLYYIGAESGRYNIFKQSINLDGSVNGASKRMTNQNKNGVVSFSVSNQGAIIYTTLFDLYQIR